MTCRYCYKVVSYIFFLNPAIRLFILLLLCVPHLLLHGFCMLRIIVIVTAIISVVFAKKLLPPKRSGVINLGYLVYLSAGALANHLRYLSLTGEWRYSNIIVCSKFFYSNVSCSGLVPLLKCFIVYPVHLYVAFL